MTTTKYAPENFFTPGQLARQGVMDYLIITHGVKPLAKDFLPIADWVLHGGPSSYVDTLVEESGSGLIEEIYETLSEAAEQINEDSPEPDYGRAVLQFIPGDWSDEATAAPINEFDHLIKNQTDRGNWIALDINPDDFKPVERDYSRIAVVPARLRPYLIEDHGYCICVKVGEEDVRLDDRDFFCLIEVNPDDFKPVEDRPFKKGDRVWVGAFGGIKTSRWSNIAGTWTGTTSAGYHKVSLDNGLDDGLPCALSELSHLAPESSNYTKAVDLVNA